MDELLTPLLPPEVPLWVAAVAVAALVILGLFWARRLLLSRLGRLAERTNTDVDDLIVAVIGRTQGWFLVFVGLAVGASALAIPPRTARLVHIAVILGVGLQAGIWLTTLLIGAVRLWIRQSGASDRAVRTTMGTLHFLVHLVVWSAVVLIVLGNLGIDVTALVAGLGVGGVAVALAVQSVLGDLFASLSIVLDQPFEVGDFIIVDDLMGTVEHVGLKTTRVRSLWGEQLVFSNTNLLNSRIRNYQRMKERRVVFSVGVTYQTSPALVREIPGLIREAIEGAKPTRFDRAHFREFGDSALLFEAVYYVLDPDYNRYMDVQQQINLGLVERFAARGIEFAYPTQTLYLVRAEATPEPGRTAPPPWQSSSSPIGSQ
jgi:small-conductance mechanosensitive channel